VRAVLVVVAGVLADQVQEVTLTEHNHVIEQLSTKGCAGSRVREAAVAGLGVARLPHFLAADALASGALVALLSEFRLPPTGVHLVYPRGAAPLPKVKAFVETIGGALRDRLRALNYACPADQRE
jgi:DNA-binding transcriptional LysR family regulator